MTDALVRRIVAALRPDNYGVMGPPDAPILRLVVGGVAYDMTIRPLTGAGSQEG